MAAFNYIALNKTGVEQKGVLEGDSMRQVRQKLRDQGLTPIEVTPVTEKETRRTKFQAPTKRTRMTVAELALITRQIATLLNAGLPLEEVLGGVAEQADKPYIKSILIGVRAKVMEGHTLATGMSDFPRAFPHIYRATVASGEQSGRLDSVLMRLADYTEKQHYMRQKIRQALIYPTVMTFVSITIVIFLLIFVVPRMINIFEETGQALPFLTQVLVSITHFMQSYGLYLLIAIILGIIGFRMALRQESFRYKFHHFILRLPFIGNTVKVINTARFARTFGILSASSVPVLEAMHVAGELVGMLPIRESINHAIHSVREGGGISIALKRTGYFPPMSIHLIASGESSGQLEAMLERAANNQERDVEALIQSILTLFEPMLILVMGAIVLFIVLATLLPIFQLDQFTG